MHEAALHVSIYCTRAIYACSAACTRHPVCGCPYATKPRKEGSRKTHSHCRRPADTSAPRIQPCKHHPAKFRRSAAYKVGAFKWRASCGHGRQGLLWGASSIVAHPTMPKVKRTRICIHAVSVQANNGSVHIISWLLTYVVFGDGQEPRTACNAMLGRTYLGPKHTSLCRLGVAGRHCIAQHTCMHACTCTRTRTCTCMMLAHAHLAHAHLQHCAHHAVPVIVAGAAGAGSLAASHAN
eukprot:365377-Chlamydomonas_euryale.AAC.6